MPLSDADRSNLLNPRTGIVRAVIDTDTFNEIDDQFAVVQALLSPDRIDLEAIYACPFSNSQTADPGVGMEQSYNEILALLMRLRIEPAGFVHKGVRQYVGSTKRPQSAAAVEDLINRARNGSSENPLYIIAIGAISNVASALILAPDIIDRVVVVWLGGHSLEWPHQREFNLRQDVGGTQVLFDSGAAVVLIPCQGVVTHLHTTVPEIERYVEPFGDIGKFLAYRFKGYEKDHMGWSKEIWDMSAVGWVLNASWTPSVLIPTPILTDNITYSCDRSRHLLRYVTMVRRDPIMKDFFGKLAAAATHLPAY